MGLDLRATELGSKFVKIRTLLMAGLMATTTASAQAEPFEFKALWKAGIEEIRLKSWPLGAISKLKSQSVGEENSSGKPARWRGVPLSLWIDQALAEVPLEKRAKVDLVVLTGASGKLAIIPRYVIKKYPILLVYEKDKAPLSAEEGPLASIVPRSVRKQMVAEGLPQNTFGLQGISQVELTSYGARFSNLLLKRRTDPAAIRGEKMFVQTCIACHASGRARPVHEIASNPGSIAAGSAGRSLSTSQSGQARIRRPKGSRS